MEGNCGLNSWEANSAVVLASASGPADVFRPYKTLMSPFAHNPTLHAVPGGGLLIAHIGQGKPEHPLISNCTNGTTPLPTDSEVKHPSSKPALKLGVRGASLPAPNFLYLASGDPTDGSEWEVRLLNVSVLVSFPSGIMFSADDVGDSQLLCLGCEQPRAVHPPERLRPPRV